MEMRLNIPGDHKTQSAVAVIAYSYILTRSELKRLTFYKEPICTGPTIMHLTIEQSKIRIRLNRKKIVEILNSMQLPYLKLAQSDGRGVVIPAASFEMIVQEIESIPPAMIDRNAIIKPIKFQ